LGVRIPTSIGWAGKTGSLLPGGGDSGIDSYTTRYWAFQNEQLATALTFNAGFPMPVSLGGALTTRETAPPIVAAQGTVQAAPAATVVLADSGALPAGLYIFECSVINQDDAAANFLDLVERNALNNADVSVFEIPVGAGPSGFVQTFIKTLALNERLVLRLKANATAGSHWQGGVNVYSFSSLPGY